MLIGHLKIAFGCEAGRGESTMACMAPEEENMSVLYPHHNVLAGNGKIESITSRYNKTVKYVNGGAYLWRKAIYVLQDQPQN